jgi:hypothetical protein
MSGRGRWLALAAAASVALVGCGSIVPAAARGQQRSARLPSLATSVLSQDGTSWAVVQMGGSAARQENFWQLFARPHGSVAWQLATPAGVADNGGLVFAATGQQSALTGFRPSQDLKFSPLAATANSGKAWSATGPVQPGLADIADGLAAGPSGKLIALTSKGAAVSTNGGSSWASLIAKSALAAAGRRCGLTAITAAAYGANGSPMLAGACGRPGAAGIFDQSAGTWQLAGPRLPAALSRSAITVLALSTSGSTTTAVLAAGSGRRARLYAAWLIGGSWTLSAAFPVAGLLPTSVASWPGGALGLVLPGSRGAVLSPPTKASPHGQWQLLAIALPARTSTLAEDRTGQPEALAADRSVLTIWHLTATAGQSAGWQRAQTIKVTIPYGSSS